MLRITTSNQGPTTILRLEGKLLGGWVTELDRDWLTIKIVDPQKKFRIDLSDVEFVDEKGEALL